MSRLRVTAFRRLGPAFALDVDFSVDLGPEGGIAALFGPSGCGKSSTLAAIAGLLSPERGRVEFDGRTLFDDAAGVDLPPERRGVGLVAQDGLLFPHLDVAANLAYAERRARGEPVATRAEIEDALGTAPLAARSPVTLSGGERQRVALARALLARPRLLLLDEPASSLDEAARWRALEFVEAVSRRFRVPCLHVTHATSEVARLADTVVRLHAGRVAETGPTARVLAAAAHGAAVPNVFRATGLGEPGAPEKASIDGGAVVHLPRGLAAGASVWCRLSSGAIALEPAGTSTATSARNRLAGRVVELRADEGRVRAAVDAGPLLHVDVTPEAARQLALAEGAAVACVFKAHAVELLG